MIWEQVSKSSCPKYIDIVVMVMIIHQVFQVALPVTNFWPMRNQKASPRLHKV